ncbi:MAG: hypothetical protein KatS3mg077_1216 [Candidatus Binatia bacterium]|nr:MAG: hypothetical protein KatS3mg077_1216 [Candidatus Binatia bacterium]
MSLSILVGCGGGGSTAAEEEAGIPYRLLEGSSLTFSPDPPSPTSVVTEPLTGTFRLEWAPIRAFGVFLTGLRLQAGNRFMIESMPGEKALLIGGQEVDVGLAGDLGGEPKLLVNGKPVDFRGGGPYCPLWGGGDDPRLALARIELCAPALRCAEIRSGTVAGYVLTIVAVPER